MGGSLRDLKETHEERARKVFKFPNCQKIFSRFVIISKPKLCPDSCLSKYYIGLYNMFFAFLNSQSSRPHLLRPVLEGILLSVAIGALSIAYIDIFIAQ